MNTKQKILMAIAVGMLVILGILLFIRTFIFEADKEDIESFVDEAYVNELYNNIYLDEYENEYSFYNGYKSRYTDISAEYILKTAINNLRKNNLLENNLTSNDLATVLMLNENIKPLAKIEKTKLNDVIYKLFKNERSFNYKNFNLDNNIKGLNTDNYIYLYIDESIDQPRNYIYHEKESYELANNKETLLIYDYFIKCNKETTKCYNDNRMLNINNYLTYVNDTLQGDKGKIVKYKHTYKLDNDHFYWYSSEMVEN